LKEIDLKIHIEYDPGGHIDQGLLSETRDIARKYGDLSERPWFIRSSAIDLETILEIIGTFTSLNILDELTESLVGKDYFVEIEKRCRKGAHESVDRLRAFLVDFFQNIISRNKDRYGAFALVEHLNDFQPFYVVLNNKRMSINLIETLPEAIALSTFVMGNTDIEDAPRTTQLYPNFQTGTWDYILMPTNRAFGEYVDRFYDLKKRELVYLSSPEAFLSKFDPDDKDDFKFLINPKREQFVSKLNEL